MSDEPLLEIYLQPGESQLVHRPAVIRTVLGSCVGITFSHRPLGLGAMCHPMLPNAPIDLPSAHSPSLNARPTTRFVDFAIEDMARKLDALGAPRCEIEIKLFGGADVLTVDPSRTKATVGSLNCDAALRVLAAQGFQISASSLGGTCGINIQFHTGTGEVLLRRLGSSLHGNVVNKSLPSGGKVARSQR